MNISDIRPFLETNHRAVVTSFRRNGAAQVSILVAGFYQDAVVFVISGSTAKLANLRRDPRCSVLTVDPHWSSFAVMEGAAEIHSQENTGAAELRLLLRDAYRACGGGEHSDWDEYDRVMKEEKRAVVMVKPGRVYGMLP